MRPIMNNNDHWVPYDEDDNYTTGSDDGDGQSTNALIKEQHAFISSTCIINPQYNSIEIHGADLNTKIIDCLFEQIHQRLIEITNKQHSINKNNDDTDENIKEHSLFDIAPTLCELKDTLHSLRLVYVAMTLRSLALLSNIIHLCCNTLMDIQLELLIPIKNTTKHSTNDELKIIGLFHQMMTKCSVLPHLEGIGIDLINFPLECYDYFTYFRASHTFVSLKTLRIFICKDNSTNHRSIQHLLRFIEEHHHLDAVRIVINDIEDDGIWDELLSTDLNANDPFDTSRFQLFQKDVSKFNKICFNILNSLNNSQKRCNGLKAFSLYHYLSNDINEYMDMLSMFISKHIYLSEISIVFNCISDIYLAKLFTVMHTTEGLMDNLEYIELDSTKLHEFEVSDSFNWVTLNEIEHIQDDIHIEDDMPLAVAVSTERRDDVEQEIKINDEKSNNNRYKHPMYRDFKQQHFGKHSVLELATLVSKCRTLINLDIKCFYGVDLNAFIVLTESIIHHENLSKITINNLQRRNGIFDGLQNIFALKRYAFINTLSIEFNRHYLDALRREKYTIPDSFYQELNNSRDLDDNSSETQDEMEIQLRPNCDVIKVLRFADSLFESQMNLLKYIDGLQQCLAQKCIGNMSFPDDIIQIIVNYLIYNHIDEDNELMISLQSLPNDMKSKVTKYFIESHKEKEVKWNKKVYRRIKFNSNSGSSGILKDDEDGDIEGDPPRQMNGYDDEDEDVNQTELNQHDDTSSSFADID